MRTRHLLGVGLTSAVAAAGIAVATAWPTARATHGDHPVRPDEQAAAMVATARYQDVAVAEADGWASTIDTLGCFQNPTQGGMGVHYVNDGLMDASVDVTKPEALVYELDADGQVVGLVAHEYIVPTEAWTSSRPRACSDAASTGTPYCRSGWCTPGSGRTTRPACSPTGTPPYGRAPPECRSSVSTSRRPPAPAANRSTNPDDKPGRWSISTCIASADDVRRA